MNTKTNLSNATDEAGSVPVPDTASDGIQREAPREFLRVGRKILSEAELATPAARRFMIAEIERLDAECVQLRTVVDEFNDLRVKFGRLEERARTSRWLEILSSVCLLAGAAGLGAAPSYLSVSGVQNIGWTFVVGSGALTIIGIVSRMFR